MTRQELGELAIEILLGADLDDNSEDGDIRVDPNLLFRFYVMRHEALKNTEVTHG